MTARLDGDLQALYDELGINFRARFYPVVHHLLSKGTTRVNVLANEIDVSQPAATQTVAEMIKLGLVEAAAGSDGRERLISLTAHGTRTAEQLGPLWRAIEDAAQELDAELPMPLAALIASTFHALERESFQDRIRRKMEDG